MDLAGENYGGSAGTQGVWYSWRNMAPSGPRPPAQWRCDDDVAFVVEGEMQRCEGRTFLLDFF